MPTSLGVKSGKEDREFSPRATFRLAEYGTQGIEATSKEAFGWVAVSEAA